MENKLQTAAEAAAKTISHKELMESLKPKFFAKLNEEINRASSNAQNKLVYTKGMYPKDLVLYVLPEIRELGYQVTLVEPLNENDKEILTIQWKEDNEQIN